MAIINTINNGLPAWDKLPALWAPAIVQYHTQTNNRYVYGYGPNLEKVNNKFYFAEYFGSDQQGSSGRLTPMTTFTLILPEMYPTFGDHNTGEQTGNIYRISFQAYERYGLFINSSMSVSSLHTVRMYIVHYVHDGNTTDYFGDSEESLLDNKYIYTGPAPTNWAYFEIV